MSVLINVNDSCAARLMGGLTEGIQCRRCVHGCIKAIDGEARVCCDGTPLDKLPMVDACKKFAFADEATLAARGISPRHLAV